MHVYVYVVHMHMHMCALHVWWLGEWRRWVEGGVNKSAARLAACRLHARARWEADPGSLERGFAACDVGHRFSGVMCDELFVAPCNREREFAKALAFNGWYTGPGRAQRLLTLPEARHHMVAGLVYASERHSEVGAAEGVMHELQREAGRETEGLLVAASHIVVLERPTAARACSLAALLLGWAARPDDAPALTQTERSLRPLRPRPHRWSCPRRRTACWSCSRSTASRCSPRQRLPRCCS